MKTHGYYYFALLLMVLMCRPVQAADLKIGFVNPVKVLESAPQVKAANLELEKEFAPRDRQIGSAQKEILRLEEKIVKNEAIMSEKELSRLKREVLGKKRELKRTQDEFKEDYNIRRSEELNKLQRKIYKAIESLAQQDGYDLIVSEGVIWAGEKVDITDKVLERLQSTNLE